jgi:hypothetical protein
MPARQLGVRSRRVRRRWHRPDSGPNPRGDAGGGWSRGWPGRCCRATRSADPRGRGTDAAATSAPCASAWIKRPAGPARCRAPVAVTTSGVPARRGSTRPAGGGDLASGVQVGDQRTRHSRGIGMGARRPPVRTTHHTGWPLWGPRSSTLAPSWRVEAPASCGRAGSIRCLRSVCPGAPAGAPAGHAGRGVADQLPRVTSLPRRSPARSGPDSNRVPGTTPRGSVCR